MKRYRVLTDLDTPNGLHFERGEEMLSDSGYAEVLAALGVIERIDAEERDVEKGDDGDVEPRR